MRKVLWITCSLLLAVLFFPATCRAGNSVLGEIHFEGKSNIEKTSGVWVDGEYVGYLKELKGAKKVMLLPGKHAIRIRQDGYKDFVQEVTLQPGELREVSVAMVKADATPPLHATSTVKISANPSRAAVFVDGLFVGHVSEFRGWGRAMLVEPGVHQISIALPGYETFQTDLYARPNQTVAIKTDLLKSNVPIADPLLKLQESDTSSSHVGNLVSGPGAMATTGK